MQGLMFAETEDKHFRLQEMMPKVDSFTASLEPIQGSSSRPCQPFAAAGMQHLLQMGGSLDSYNKADRLLKPGNITVVGKLNIKRLWIRKMKRACI